MKIRDRIRELRRVRAGDLRPNPKNWRTHPDRQREALQGVLAEIGYADALLARELPDGSLMLIDGHLRAETTPEQEVPVLVLDLDEAEAEKLLAVLDPMSALAGRDESLLADLLTSVETESAALQTMLDELLHERPEGDREDGFRGEKTDLAVPELYQVLVECQDEEEQRELFERLHGEGRRCRILNL